MKFNRRELFTLAFLGLTAFLFWVFYLYSEPVFLSNPDSAKFADVARNFKNGEGLVTDYAICKGAIADHCFTFTSPPLFSVVSSFFMRVFGENDRAVIFTSGFFYILTCLLVYFLAKNLFNYRVALFSSLAFIFTEQFIFHSVAGASETFFTFLVLVILLLIVKQTNLSLLLAGIFSFLLLGTKMQSLIYVLGLMFLILFLGVGKKRKVKNLFIYLLPIIIFYFGYRSLDLGSFSNPRSLLRSNNLLYFLFYNSPVFPSGSIDQFGGSFSLAFLFSNIKPILSKIVFNFYTAFKNILTITNPFIMVLFFLSFLKKEDLSFGRQGKGIAFLRWMALFWIVFFLMTGVVGVFNIRYVHPVLPLVIIFAVSMFFEIAAKFTGRKKPELLLAGGYILIFLVLFPLTQINLGAKITKKGRNTGKSSVYKIIGESFADSARESDMVGTNVEVWGSWYGKRKTILLPDNLALLSGKINVVVLSSFSPGTEMGKSWQEVFDKGGGFDGFKLVDKIEIAAVDNYQNIPVKLVVFKRK